MFSGSPKGGTAKSEGKVGAGSQASLGGEETSETEIRCGFKKNLMRRRVVGVYPRGDRDVKRGRKKKILSNGVKGRNWRSHMFWAHMTTTGGVCLE